LLEDDDVLLLQAKVVVLLEEVGGRAASRPAGHDVPWDGYALLVVLLGGQHLGLPDPLTLQLEQALLARKANVEASLGR